MKAVFAVVLVCVVVFLVAAQQENPPPDEPGRIANIGNIFQSLMNSAYQNGDPWLRNAHAKGHGCVRAHLNVSSFLSPNLAQGIFVPGASYPVFLRYSNGAGRGFTTLFSANKSDALPDNRGLALKIFLKNGGTQDFLWTTDRNGFLPDAKTAEGFFTAVSKGNLATATFLTLHPSVGTAYALLGVSGATTNLLKKTFWQQVPSKYGNTAVKFMAVPCYQNQGLPDGPNTFKNFLRDNLKANLATGATACYDINVQFYQDDQSTPIENAMVQWNTPWQAVAKLEIEPYAAQYSFGPNQNNFCDSMSFNPWHTVPDHQPLGSLNRIRKTVYTNDATNRHSLQGQNNNEVTIKDWMNFPNL